MEKSSKIIISHRGNLTGPNTATNGENHPKSIQDVLDEGFLCEVDARWIEGEGFFLGHDKPEYKVDKSFFNDHRLYIHCKDILTFDKLHPYPNTYMKMFFHQTDDMTLVLNADFFWSFPRADILLTKRSIAVLPELVKDWKGLDICAGICTDYPMDYNNGSK